MFGGDATRIPETFRDAIRFEVARTFTFPFESISTIAINGILVIVGWFFMPPFIEDLMFSNHAPMAFAVVLAVWMYSDVPSTNQPGSDSQRFIEVLDRPREMHRLLWARRIVLWMLVTPIAGIASLALGLAQGRMVAALFGFAWIVIVPFGVLAVAPLLGVRWPYRPIPLSERWARRSQWKRFLLRWSMLVVAPYVWVPLLGLVLTVPSLWIWGVSSSAMFPEHVSIARFALGTFVGVFVTGLAIGIGSRWMGRLVSVRREALRRELADPDLG